MTCDRGLSMSSFIPAFPGKCFVSEVGHRLTGYLLLFGCMLPHDWDFRLRVYFDTKMPATLSTRIQTPACDIHSTEVRTDKRLSLFVPSRGQGERSRITNH